MNKNVSKVLLRKVLNYGKANKCDLNVAFDKFENEHHSFDEDTVKATRKYLHENYTAITAAYSVDNSLSNYTI